MDLCWAQLRLALGYFVSAFGLKPYDVGRILLGRTAQRGPGLFVPRGLSQMKRSRCALWQ